MRHGLRQVVTPARINHSRRSTAEGGLVGAVSRTEKRDRELASVLPRGRFHARDAAEVWGYAVGTASDYLCQLRDAGLVRWVPKWKCWVRHEGFPG